MQRVPVVAALIVLLAAGAQARAESPAPSAVDSYVARPRIVVLTDIANEPDDQMSLVRFLVYSNQFDVEGLVATTSTWMKSRVRPDVILTVLDAYQEAQPNLALQAPGFPTAAALRAVVAAGQPGYGMAAVGPDEPSPGAELLVRAALRPDPRPLWVLAWGGANTLAQALVTARATRTPVELDAIVAKLRVYSISDQDDAGPWLRREYPGLRYVVTPSTPDGEQYYLATWTGISGDSFYRNAPGADLATFSDEWVDANIRSKGPLGKHYPYPCCIHEGDTPSFLGLIANGLASAMSPAYGGWGGRYVYRQPSGETRPIWTQGGDSYPGRDSSRDTVTGADGNRYTSDQATIWRWRRAFQNDFAARMDWTVKPVAEANHNPLVMLNGRGGGEPLMIEARVGEPVTLDAAGTTDPDGHALSFDWFFYPEAGSGIPGQPVLAPRPRPARPDPTAGPPSGAGGIPSAPRGGPRDAPARVVVENAAGSRSIVTPKVAGIAHVILAVADDGTPSLTSYRRAILMIAPAASSGTASGAPQAPVARPRVALTFDDLPAHGALPAGMTRSGVARSILDTLTRHKAPATYGFVNARALETGSDNALVLRLWRAAGHPLANHTYSHMNLSAHSAKEFLEDVARNEMALREHMGDQGWRWLRYPYLREGDTLEKRRAVRHALGERGYRIAQVTMSFDDWAYNDPYARCLAKGDTSAIEWLKRSYAERAKRSLAEAQTSARRVYGRDIPHVMLLHVGALQTVMLGTLFELLETSGFGLVTLEEAQADPAYAIDPDHPAAIGTTLQQQMADAKGLTLDTPADDTLARLGALCR
jgi:peptidoglycan/xylan/chitin deacetylase (PgdA/CDA1 family)